MVLTHQNDISTGRIVCDNGMPAFLACPTDGDAHPTIILMHERYGLVKHTEGPGDPLRARWLRGIGAQFLLPASRAKQAKRGRRAL